MVLDFFNLRAQPFGVTPDPRFWFASATHREALASLLYGLEAERGFVALVAKPGMGKTTLLFNGLGRIGERVKTVFLFQRVTSAKSLLQALLADLGVQEIRGSLIELQRKLNDACAEQARSGKRVVVVIDEAQNLDESVLEFVRMLSNFETSSRKLMQIVLAGQMQLAEKMASPAMTQLRQRISIFAHLTPLSAGETASYIDHRLRTAGYNAKLPLFAPSAMSLIASHSQGIPRNINNLCFNAMSVGFALQRRTIDDEILREVISDLNMESFTAQALANVPSPTPERVPDLRSKLPEKCHPAQVRPTLDEVMADLDRRLSMRAPTVLKQASISEAKPETSARPLAITSVEDIQLRKSGVEVSPALTGDFIRLLGPRQRFSPGSIYRSAGAGILLSMLICSLAMVVLKKDHVDAATAPAGVTASPSSAIETPLSAVAKEAPANPPPKETPSSPSATRTPSSPTLKPEPPQPSGFLSVVVREGQSLDGICAENFANCTPDLLERIRKLNPEIRSANHIEPGQAIRIPTTSTADASVD